jgi:hypothetical protein
LLVIVAFTPKLIADPPVSPDIKASCPKDGAKYPLPPLPPLAIIEPLLITATPLGQEPSIVNAGTDVDVE